MANRYVMDIRRNVHLTILFVCFKVASLSRHPEKGQTHRKVGAQSCGP